MSTMKFKHKSFVLRLVSLVVIVAALLTYNLITQNRLERDAEARAAAETVTVYDPLAGDVLTEDPGSTEPTATAASAGVWKDGTYEGEATGYGGPIKVSVVVSGGKVTSIGVLSHTGEDDAYYSMAEAVIPAVIDAQSTAVDTVSGATFSSNGILGAVDDALGKAVN